MTKEEALKKIEELKKYVDDEVKEEKVVGVKINSVFGSLIFQSTKTTIKEAVVEAVESGADLRYADLIGADLSYTDLSDVDLSYADLSYADLSYENLHGADLHGADLRDANLSYANLRYADLRDANLHGADLHDAELNKALFYGRGGKKELKRSQLPHFLGALGFLIVED